MKFYMKCALLVMSAFTSLTLAQCGTSNQQAEPAENNNEIEPIVINKVDPSGGRAEQMWDETYNTQLLLKIHRLI